MVKELKEFGGDYSEVVESWSDRLIKRALCKICRLECLVVPEHPTNAQIRAALVGLQAHFEIQHGLQAHLVECDNPECCK